MGKITKRSEHIEQCCRVYGEHHRDILFKKWSFRDWVDPSDCHVFLIVKEGYRKDRVYDTKEEAYEARLEVLKTRFEKILNKGESGWDGWLGVQFSSIWERGLEDDTEEEF